MRTPLLSPPREEGLGRSWFFIHHHMRTRGPQSGFRKTVPLRRKLRQQATHAEKIFWRAVAQRQLGGLKFRRQHGIGGFIVDFYCVQKKLIIEIDGDSHFQDGAQARDMERTNYLESLGYNVIRYTNLDVVNNLDGIMQDLLEKISSAPSSSPARGGEEQPR